MRRYYILQELYVINGRHYWWDICTSYDLKMLKRLKLLYKEKNKCCLYRVNEVVF